MKTNPLHVERHGTFLTTEIQEDAADVTARVAVVNEGTNAASFVVEQTIVDADGKDVCIITVQVSDLEGRLVPTADNESSFEITGPGKIIGVGNGDPSSHEPDKYVDSVDTARIAWRTLRVDSTANRPEVAFDFDDSSWPDAFAGGSRRDGRRDRGGGQPSQIAVFRGVFELPPMIDDVTFSLLLRSVSEQQSIYLNGEPIAEDVGRDSAGHQFELDPEMLRPGKNVIAIVAAQPDGRRGRGRAGRGGSNPALASIVASPGNWKRNLFSGLAQVIVQSTEQAGTVTLTARSSGLTPATIEIQSRSHDATSILQLGD